MLIRLGAARDSGTDARLAWSLAGIAGALNTAGFYAANLYSSNMTGNVSAVADHLALADLGTAATYLALVAIFISGAAVSAMLISAGRRREMVGIYAFSVLAESVLLMVLAAADFWLSGGPRGAVLAFGLSFLMGMQNAVVTRISNARVRTTHVTGMVTDIGIELGHLADAMWHRGRGDFNGEKLKLHAFTVLSFMGGGIVGVLAYRSLGPVFLFAMAVVLLGLALFALARRRALVQPQRAG